MAANSMNMTERGIYNYRKLNVIRMDPVLVCPAKETPREVLYLSNIDDQPILRSTNKVLLVYATSLDSDPAVVISDALSKALVYYYPLAGRFRKTENAKLEVNCNGEGAVFIRGNANCSLKDVGYLAHPTSFSKHLFYQFPETYQYHDIPPLVIQVTRFVCGGFVVTFAISHCMADAGGLSLFSHALAEIARGMPSPSINPVWKRHLLAPRNPPQIGFHHPEFQVIQSSSYTTNKSEFRIEGSFLITAPSITKLKQKVLEETKGSLKSCSRFEALAAFVWKSRVKALRFPSDQQVQLLFAINARKIFNPPLPEGYYGNAIISPCITLYVKELSEICLGDLVQMIRKMKINLRDDYLRSTIDFIEVHREKLAKQGLPSNTQLYLTDLTRMKPMEVDFGWGKAVNVCDELLQEPDGSFLPPLAIGNHRMKDGVRFVTCLPAQAMFTFQVEMQRLLDIRCAL